MKKTILLICTLLISLSVMSQDKKYYEFGWKEHYGIVDVDGNEVVSPVYEWIMINFSGQSDYTVLNSDERGAYVINTTTGESELFGALINYVIDIKEKEYTYGYNDERAFLINNLDFKDRIELPKKYESVKQVGDYLIGIVEYLDQGMCADLVSKIDFKVKKQGIVGDSFETYKRKTGGSIYIIEEGSNTKFFDEQLDMIGQVTKPLDSFEKVSAFLKKTKQIELIEPDELDIVEVAIGSYNDFSSMSFKSNIDTEGNMVYKITSSSEVPSPFFKIKIEERPKFKFYNDRINNKIEGRFKIDDMQDQMYFMFHVDLESRKIFFPRKYWKELKLQEIGN